MEQFSLFESMEERLEQSRKEKEEALENDEKAFSLRPLADRMRPQSLEDYWGQKHLVAQGSLLWNMINRDSVVSMIFWGPPGVGKTTLARIIAHQTKSEFINFSAVTSGIKEIREVMAQAEARRKKGNRTIVFVDEIHRFNKAQQDAFLPYVEKGSIVLIGATTENPSFEVNSALLSRCRVFVLKSLEQEDIEGLIRQALFSPKGFGDRTIHISDDFISSIAFFAHGDARLALNTLEMIINNSPDDIDGVHVDESIVRQVMQKERFFMIKKAISITISSQRCTNRCEIQMWMPAFTGWPECLKVEKTPFISHEEWFGWPVKISDWLIQELLKSVLLLIRPVIFRDARMFSAFNTCDYLSGSGSKKQCVGDCLFCSQG